MTTQEKEVWFKHHKFRYERHWKACQTCKYHECKQAEVKE